MLSGMEALTVSTISWYRAIVSCYMDDIIAPTENGEFLKSNPRQLHKAILAALVMVSENGCPVSMRHLSCKNLK